MLTAVSSGALLALILFVSGLVSLLLWLALMLDNPRLGQILRKSVLIFLLPGALMIVIPIIAPAQLLLPFVMMGPWALVGLVLLFVLFEEVLKSCAARSEARPYDKFAFAMLFGIFELAIAKPLSPLIAGDLMGEWSRWGLIGLAIGAMLAMMMHSVTAALYAFRFADRKWLGLLTCFAIHAFYNFVVIAFLSVTLVVIAAIIFAIFLIALLPEGEPEELLALES